MTMRLLFVAAILAVTGANSCEDGAENCEADMVQVSLLQTDIAVNKAEVKRHGAHQPHHWNKEGHTVLTGKPAAAPKAAALLQQGDKRDEMVCAGVIVALLIAARIIYGLFLSGSSTEAYLPQFVAEFLGTFMLVFAVGCNVLVGDATWGVLSIASTLMVAIYALGGVSGANFNPAVSVSLGLSQKMPWAKVAAYVCIQLAAGLTGQYTAKQIASGHDFSLAPTGTHSLLQAGLAELFYTFMLTFVVLNVAAIKDASNEFYGLAIGFTVVAGGYGAGKISGGCFNPAIAFALDISSLNQGYGNSFYYMAAEFIGCAIAAALFRVCRPQEFSDSDIADTKTAKLTSEFLGTFMLVLTVTLNGTNQSAAGALSIAAALMCMIFALGGVSGAHFNPAVTVAILASGRSLINAMDAALYIAAQVAGGLAGAFATMVITGGRTVPLRPGGLHTSWEALHGEFFFTFLLAFVVLAVATVAKPLSQFFGLAIGACVIAGGYAIGGVSGGSLNPAVTIALSLTDLRNGGELAHLFTYCIVETLAGVMAAAVFMQTHAQDASFTSK